nr:uncharacterized protein LOC127339530 [Lolium perenne]
MGHRGGHRQGSLSLAGHIQKERRETKVEPSFFTVWKRTRTLDEPDPDRKGSMWVSDGSELRYTEYCKKLGEMLRTDVDPLSVPFDPEVAVLAGQGKRNGRLWIGDGCIHPATIPSIRQLRRGRTSSDPQIETHPTPSSVAMQRIQAQVEEQNKLREEAEARVQRMEEQMMLHQQQLAQQQKTMDRLA